MLQTGKIVSVIFNDDNYADKVELNLGDYEIIEEHGKTDAVKKKKEYPKTYEECCKVLGIDSTINHVIGTHFRYRDRIMSSIKLLICRDAYWKLYGEEIIGKPWAPDYDSGVNKYGIICMNGVVQESNPTTNWERHLNKVLDFPTAEMRDTFKKNFDPDIEFCKEFL